MIAGTVAPGFEGVREAFEANFQRQDLSQEVGASLCVYRQGQPVVDLWGGWRDAAATQPWTGETLANVWSTTKGVTALLVASLVDQGRLDYEAPVARYWPEFAVAGKAQITVAQLLSHQAGLPGFAEPTPLEDFYDWQTVTGRLAAQAPMWSPGEKNSYHAMTFGFLAGELIRRATGLSVGAYLRTFGLDIHIGLPEAEEARVASMLPPREAAPFDPETLPPEAVAAVFNPAMEPAIPASRAWRAAEVPAGNGHANARGLARMFGAAANGGRLDDLYLMSPQTLGRMTAIQTRRPDVMLGFSPCWAMGVALNEAGVFGPRPRTFGHSGWGGSFACADAETGIAIAYVMNQMGPGLVGDPRAAALCHAVFAAG